MRPLLLNTAACLGLALALNSCTSTQASDPGKTIIAGEQAQKKLNDEQSVMAVLFQQQSAEYRALCLQAYHFAQLRIDNSIRDKKGKLPLAVITDLDETAIDNGLQYGWMYKNNRTFNSKDWDEWCKMKKATAIPGSLDFFNYANVHKVDIFYVSNRDQSQLDATIENMKSLGFPQLSSEHFLFKVKESSKQNRRNEIAKTHNIVLLLGDNLNDFDAVYEGKSIADRKTEVDKTAKEWGEKFVVLPNAIYGEWENALYNYNFKLTIEQKDSVRVSKLEGY